MDFPELPKIADVKSIRSHSHPQSLLTDNHVPTDTFPSHVPFDNFPSDLLPETPFFAPNSNDHLSERSFDHLLPDPANPFDRPQETTNPFDRPQEPANTLTADRTMSMAESELSANSIRKKPVGGVPIFNEGFVVEDQLQQRTLSMISADRRQSIQDDTFIHQKLPDLPESVKSPR
jgi:hypothetical protein